MPMNIALIAHDNKKELMAQFCTAYLSSFSKHILYATSTTGAVVSAATGLSITSLLMGAYGGSEQIGARIECGEIDIAIFFLDPNDDDYEGTVAYLAKCCDRSTIPFATNAATAEALVFALDRGDLDWLEIAHPKINGVMHMAEV